MREWICRQYLLHLRIGSMDMGDISMLVLVLIWLGGIYWALFTDVYWLIIGLINTNWYLVRKDFLLNVFGKKKSSKFPFLLQIKWVANVKSAGLRLWQRSIPAGRQTVREGVSRSVINTPVQCSPLQQGRGLWRREQGVATPAILCHKDAWMLVLYGIELLAKLSANESRASLDLNRWEWRIITIVFF